MASAAATGAPVEVTERTTETSRTWANPNGTFKSEFAAAPVRVKRSGAWLAVDPTLVANADGTLSPKVAATSLVLSGGGTSAPLVRFGTGPAQVSLTWPGTLPKPTVSGDTATYAEVLPGVDLAVSADSESFKQVLVVKNATAAKLASVLKPVYGFTVQGGTLTQTASGGFAVIGPLGNQVMASPRGLMWDSSGTAAATGAEPQAISEAARSATLTSVAAASGSSAEGPGEAAKVAQLGEAVSGASLALTADAALLSSSSTVFPVYIDPPVFRANQSGHTMIDKSHSGSSYWNWTDVDQGVGYQNFDGVSTKRLHFQFPTAGIVSKHILSATLSDTETWASSCAARPVEAWLTGPISASTTWAQPTNWSDPAAVAYATANASHGNASCTTSSSGNVTPYDALVEWNVTAAVDWAANHSHAAITTFGIKAPSETDNTYWKRFKSSAILSVTYNSPAETAGLTHRPRRGLRDTARRPRPRPAPASPRSPPRTPTRTTSS